MHISRMVKIHWDLLKHVWQADNCQKMMKLTLLAIPKLTKFDENPLKFTQAIARKWK